MRLIHQQELSQHEHNYQHKLIHLSSLQLMVLNTCTETFPVVVSAHVGTSYYVGEGMSTKYGQYGFEHLSPLYTLLNGGNAYSDAAGGANNHYLL